MALQRVLAPFTRDELDISKKVGERLTEGRLDILAMPQVVTVVLGLLDDEKASVADIAREVGRDQGITTHVLALANSAFYGAATRIASIEQAVVRLGLRELKGAVLIIGLKSVFRNKSYSALSNAIWEHSLAAAIVARRLADAVGEDADTAFMAGLVHDIGRVAVLAVYDKMEKRNEAPRVSDDVLAQILDEYHEEAGALVSKEWELPSAAAEVIASHHGSTTVATATRMRRIVSLADCLADVMGFASPGAAGPGHDPQALCRELGVSTEAQIVIIEEAPRILAELEAATS